MKLLRYIKVTTERNSIKPVFSSPLHSKIRNVIFPKKKKREAILHFGGGENCHRHLLKYTHLLYDEADVTAQTNMETREAQDTD